MEEGPRGYLEKFYIVTETAPMMFDTIMEKMRLKLQSVIFAAQAVREFYLDQHPWILLALKMNLN